MEWDQTAICQKNMRDPIVDGYWIYLVLWYGVDYTKIVSSYGGLPTNPIEMKSLLDQHIHESLRNMTSTVVSDVSQGNTLNHNNLQHYPLMCRSYSYIKSDGMDCF